MFHFQSRIIKSKIRKADDGSTLYPFVISTNDIDSVADKMDVQGADLSEYELNPVIFRNHQRPALGISTKLDKRADRLIAWAKFDEITKESQETKAQIDAGTLRTASIGFEPIEWKDIPLDETNIALLRGRSRWITHIRNYTKWLLKEWSVVDIPANINAQILRGYFKGISLDNLALQFQTKIDKDFLDNEITKLIQKGFMIPEIELIKTELNELKQKFAQAGTIGTKAGAVLSSSNKALLNTARDNIQAVLDAATPPETGKSVVITDADELRKMIFN